MLEPQMPLNPKDSRFGWTKPAGDPETDELFGGGATPGGAADTADLALSQAITGGENAAKARKIIVNFIETKKILMREARRCARSVARSLASCSSSPTPRSSAVTLDF